LSRSLKKGWYTHPKLLKKVMKAVDTNDRHPIRTWARASVITPEMIGLTIEVYNGKRFYPIYISDDLVGHRLGEFSPTRNFRSHVKSEKR
jgi:small subunit ribosomal protein S19